MKNILKRNTLFKKIILWYGIALLLFATVASIIFCNMYINRVYDTYLIEIAKGISSSVSEHVENSGSGLGTRDKDEIKTYTNLISGASNISSISVWIVTKDRELISLSKTTGRLEFDQVPTRYTPMLDEMFAGRDVHNNSYKKIWNRNMFGVGTPVVDSGGFIIGVVLVQTSFDMVAAAMKDVFSTLLYSSLGALAVSLLIAVFVSRMLTKPLSKIKKTALELQSGNYHARTGVSQSDELGKLAVAIDDLAGRLAIAKEESDNLENMRQNFISGISHELRTPVTVMRASLEALCDGVVTDPEKEKKYLRTMLKDSIHLQHLVNDLLDLSTLHSPELHMNMQPCNPMEILQDAVYGVQSLADDKSISLELSGHKLWEENSITVDYVRIRQLFTILLDNAIKFTPQGKAIKVTAAYRRGLVCVIEDQGCGIPPEEIKYIFDRFYQASAGQRQEGSGLGLAIAAQIASRHGIDIAVESAINEGTKITLQFPQ